MKILMVGSGGVGGFFGGKLAKAGMDVAFLARGKHLESLQKQGLRVESPEGSFQVKVKALEKPEPGQKFDLILICVKTHQTQEVLPLLTGALAKEALVISLQNGLDRHLPLIKAFGEAHVAGGLCYVGAFLKEPGVIEHRVAGKIVVGELKGGKSKRLTQIVKEFRRAKIDIDQSDEILSRQWQKLIWNVGFNGPTAMIDLPVGEILKRDEQRILVRSLMQEAVNVAQAKGVTLPKDFPEKTIAHSEKEFAETGTSMQQDRKTGKPLEWEIFYGFISQEGKRLKVPTPANDLVAGLLEVLSGKG